MNISACPLGSRSPVTVAATSSRQRSTCARPRSRGPHCQGTHWMNRTTWYSPGECRLRALASFARLFPFSRPPRARIRRSFLNREDPTRAKVRLPLLLHPPIRSFNLFNDLRETLAVPSPRPFQPDRRDPLIMILRRCIKYLRSARRDGL
jgi:hypothetical protein